MTAIATDDVDVVFTQNCTDVTVTIHTRRASEWMDDGLNLGTPVSMTHEDAMIYADAMRAEGYIVLVR